MGLVLFRGDIVIDGHDETKVPSLRRSQKYFEFSCKAIYAPDFSNAWGIKMKILTAENCNLVAFLVL